MGLYEESRALYAADEDHHGVARVLVNQGNVSKYQGEPDRARAFYEAGCQRAREQGDTAVLASGLNNLGTLAIELGDTAWATAVLEESLEIKRRSGSQSGVIQVLVNLGEVARARLDLPRAIARYEEALALALPLGDRLHIALLHYNLGLVASAQGAGARAAAEFREGLRQEWELGNRRQVAANLEGLAGIAADDGQPDQAGLLLSAAEYLRERIGAPLPEADRAAHERNLVRVRAALTGAESLAVWSRGRAMALDAVIATALTIGVATIT
jgi:tetratricopeptide (TPR) repeat protein